MSIDKFWSYFYEIYENMPRQGPGDLESTARFFNARICAHAIVPTL
jgi:hypothetical protein